MEKKHWHKLPRYIVGTGAIILSVFFVYTNGETFPFLFAYLYLIVICVTDTFRKKITNPANLSLALAGLGYNIYTAGGIGMLFAVAGLLLGFSLFIIPYVLGGMGAGDVKALAALGALLGPADIFQVFLYTALAGGILSVINYALARNMLHFFQTLYRAFIMFLCTKSFVCLKPTLSGEKLRFPYAAAIAFGFFAFVRWGAMVDLDFLYVVVGN